MGNYFEIHYNAIKYPIDSEKSRGLRNAQLGAIHAISSFFTLNKKDAAIVIMPTGSGKTAVLMLTPYLIRKQRVLVVTRSKMVCGQIAEDFSELRTLCVANVFNTSIKKPNVFELEHLYTKEYQKDLEQADVIVATPSCALSLSESDWAKENIDLVEVDEAHHTPAKTWQAYNGKKQYIYDVDSMEELKTMFETIINTDFCTNLIQSLIYESMRQSRKDKSEN